MAGTLGFCLYGLILIALTLALFRNLEFAKWQVILLIIAWVPFILFGIVMITTIGTIQGGGNVFGFLLAVLIVAGPLLAIIGVIVFVIWLMSRWRG